jgi:hypothetical protein
MAEVASYMRKGALGVKEFSQKRLSPGQWPEWVDSVFYGRNGSVKMEAKNWLEDLGNTDSDGGLMSSLVTLSLAALTEDVQLRPKMTHVCDKLAPLSLRAHSVAVQQEFREYLVTDATSETHGKWTTNSFWFLQERFRAWDRSLALGTTEPSADLLVTLHQVHDKATSIMADLVWKVETRRKDKEITRGTLTAKDADSQYAFENQIDQLVESLWDLLPRVLQRYAQDYWHQAILCTDSQGVLDDVRQTLKLRYTVYNIADAMAKMRKLRLRMLHPGSFESAAEACSISLSDIEFISNYGGHTLGRYKESVPVLVERMWYTPGWNNVHQEQRKFVVSLKAKSLSVDPKPSGLRIMKCIGSFEENSDHTGYGFVYRYPEGKEPEPTTLLEFLVRGYKKPEHLPLLGSKFQLAFALADYFKEFHTIGWLHESFDSHNVLFFKSSTNNHANCHTISHELRQPYVVGLHKSRPDGSFWQTDGPSPDDDGSLQDYQHPEYGSTGRFHQVFDYYSLGVVLLEIGLWRPLSSWKSKFRNLGLAEIRVELIQICRDRLGIKMGAVYRDVVLRCIDGSLKESRAVALERFTEGVVRPLEILAGASI